MENDILLSVIIISYKQKKYIKEAIDSVLMQKVNFKYELLLSDDYSGDGTLEIMKEYEKKYPEIVKVIDRGKNVGATNNMLDSARRTSGKYITFLEGDDYWCDKNKLQIQVDFLENNPEFISYSHKQEGRNLENKVLGYFPVNEKEKGDFVVDGVNDLIDGKKISETTNVYRNIYLNDDNYKDLEYLLSVDSTIADSQVCSYLASLGKIYVSQKAMMVYRMRSNDGESNYNSTHKVNEIELSYMKINSELDKFFNYKYNYYKKIKNSFAICFLYDLLHFNFKNIKTDFKTCPKKYRLRCFFAVPVEAFKILTKKVKARRSVK